MLGIFSSKLKKYTKDKSDDAGTSSASSLSPSPERASKEDLVLLVSVLEATDFDSADAKASYYCVVEIVGDSVTASPVSLQTALRKSKSKPSWNFDGTFAGFRDDQKLVFTLKSCAEKVPSDADNIVGHTILDVSLHKQGFSGELPMSPAGTLKVNILPCQRFAVSVVSAKGLRDADWMGTSDPYCVCEVPGRPATRVETKVCKASLQPEWNKTFNVNVGLTESLLFVVKDRDWPKGDDALGSLTLRSEQFENGYDAEASLSGDGSAADSVLNVKISKVSPFAEDGGSATEEQMNAAATKLQSLARGRQGRKEAKMRKEEALKRYPLKLDRETGAASPVKKRGGGRWGAKAKEKASEGESNATNADKQDNAGSVAAAGVSSEDQALGDVIVGATNEQELLPRQSAAAKATGLHVTVLGAEGLKSDAGHNPEPFCICEVHGGRELFRTNVVEGTVDPVWNFVGHVDEVGSADTLDFTVKDASNHEHLLGKATLEASKFNPSGFEGEVVLQFSGRGRKAKIKLNIVLVSARSAKTKASSKPKPKGPWCFMCSFRSARCEKSRKSESPKARRRLAPTKTAEQLAISETDENPWMKMDTYATCEIPDKENTKIVTRVIMDAFAPQWDEEYMLRNWSQGDQLLLTVMDYEPAPAVDRLLGKVLLPAEDFQDYGFEGELELEASGIGNGYRSVLSVKIHMLEADDQKQVTLSEQAELALKEHIALKTPKSKIRVAPGEILIPQQRNVFNRLYNDHADRQMKQRTVKEMQREAHAKIIEELIESTCKTAPASEVDEMSQRLFAEGERRRKKREEWLGQRQKEILSELRATPETNFSEYGERAVEDPDNPRHEQLYNGAARYQARLERLKQQALQEEQKYLLENSVHRDAELDEEETEVFDRLFGEGYQRQHRAAQRQREHQIQAEEAMVHRLVLDDAEEAEQIMEETSKRLHDDADRRRQRLEKLREQQASRSGLVQDQSKKGDPGRFHMLYHDSIRRLQQQRVLQERQERAEERELREGMIHRKQEQDDKSIGRIVGQLHNPPVRKLALGGEGPDAQVDKGKTQKESNDEGKLAAKPKSGRKSASKQEPARARTPPATRGRTREASVSSATPRARSAPLEKGARVGRRGAEEEVARSSRRHADERRVPQGKAKARSTQKSEAKDEGPGVAQRRLAQEQQRNQRQQEVENYHHEDWHPEYRHSMLLRMDPAYRGKVEADLDFREMMSKAPLATREFCPVCQTMFSPDAAFCRRCGQRREGGPEPAAPLPANDSAASQSRQGNPLLEITSALKARKVRASEHFGKWDAGGDKLISAKEFRAAVQDLGINIKSRECKAILAQMDEDDSGDVSLSELNEALRQAEREFNSSKAQAMLAQGAEAHPALAELLGPSIASSSSGPRRRGTVASGQARSATPPRSATPTQTAPRKTVSGPPQDVRRSLMRHVDEDKLVGEDLLPKDTLIVGDTSISASSPALDDVRRDRRPLRQRTEKEQVVTAAATEKAGSPQGSEYVALDAATVAALQQPRERRFLLALESNIISSLGNSKIDRIELATPIPPDLRSLIHSLADYYGLQRVIEPAPGHQNMVTVTLIRTPASRTPDQTLSKICEEKGFGGEEDRKSKEASPRDELKSNGAGSNPGSARPRSATPRSSASAAQPNAGSTTPRSNASAAQPKAGSTTPRSNSSAAQLKASPRQSASEGAKAKPKKSAKWFGK